MNSKELYVVSDRIYLDFKEAQSYGNEIKSDIIIKYEGKSGNVRIITHPHTIELVTYHYLIGNNHFNNISQKDFLNKISKHVNFKTTIKIGLTSKIIVKPCKIQLPFQRNVVDVTNFNIRISKCDMEPSLSIITDLIHDYMSMIFSHYENNEIDNQYQILYSGLNEIKEKFQTNELFGISADLLFYNNRGKFEFNYET